MKKANDCGRVRCNSAEDRGFAPTRIALRTSSQRGLHSQTASNARAASPDAKLVALDFKEPTPRVTRIPLHPEGQSESERGNSATSNTCSSCLSRGGQNPRRAVAWSRVGRRSHCRSLYYYTSSKLRSVYRHLHLSKSATPLRRSDIPYRADVGVDGTHHSGKNTLSYKAWI